MERLESGEVATWDIRGFIQGCGMHGGSKIASFCL